MSFVYKIPLRTVAKAPLLYCSCFLSEDALKCELQQYNNIIWWLCSNHLTAGMSMKLYFIFFLL